MKVYPQQSVFSPHVSFSLPDPTQQLTKVTDFFVKPSLAAVSDFSKATHARPSTLTNPLEFAAAYAHAAQAGAAAAFWCWGALFHVPTSLLGNPPEVG